MSIYFPQITAQKIPTNSSKIITRQYDKVIKSKSNKNQNRTSEASLVKHKKINNSNKFEFNFIPNLQKSKRYSIQALSNAKNQRLYQSAQKIKNQQIQKSDAENFRITDMPTQAPQLELFQSKKLQKSPFKGVIEKLKLLIPNKNDKNYSKFDSLIEQLQKINPFFSKLPSESAYLLLKIGKVITLQKNKVVYQKESSSLYLYIILYGIVLLRDNIIGFIKYSKTGEVLAQYQIFTNHAEYSIKIRQSSRQKHFQSATTQIQTCLLRIKKKKYYELEHQMLQKGNHCKNLFTQINNGIKIQYLLKMRTRNHAIDKRIKKSVRRSYTEACN